MPKMKTCKTAKKRIKVTATGKLIGHRAGAGHLKSVKSAARIRHMRRSLQVPKVFKQMVGSMLGV